MILLIKCMVQTVPVLVHPVLLSLSRGKRLYRLMYVAWLSIAAQTIIDVGVTAWSIFNWLRVPDSVDRACRGVQLGRCNLLRQRDWLYSSATCGSQSTSQFRHSPEDATR